MSQTDDRFNAQCVKDPNAGGAVRVLNMADLIRSAREIGAYPPRSNSNPLSRELTDREMEAKILTGAQAVAKAEAKRARKLTKRQQQDAYESGAFV